MLRATGLAPTALAPTTGTKRSRAPHSSPRCGEGVEPVIPRRSYFTETASQAFATAVACVDEEP